MEELMSVLISDECDRIKQMLLKKNDSYGNSVAEPIHIFSAVPSGEQLNVRIDDKLSRLKHGNDYDNEDTKLDLIGYLILQRCVNVYTK